MASRYFPLFVSLCGAFLSAAQGLLPTELKQTLLSPGAVRQEGARHGSSLAADGDLIVVGAPADDTAANGAGVVHVYDVATGAVLHRLTNPNPQEYGTFGAAVAVNGMRVAVSAPSDAAGNGVNMTSHVYVYDLAGATPGIPVAVLPNPTPAWSDDFGHAVAISGTRVSVGAPGDDTASNDAGAVYIFDLTSGTPSVPVRTLPGPIGQSNYGSSVAMSGSRLAIGSGYSGFLFGTIPAGKAYVYDLASASPGTPSVTIESPQGADNFACAVALSGSHLVVGAPQDGTAALNAGRAYVFDLASPAPAAPVAVLARPEAQAGDYFGYAVAVSGGQVVVGAFNTTPNGGSVCVFDLASATPSTPVAVWENPTPAVGDQFGWAVAIAGPRVAIGARADDPSPVAIDSGSAYLYDLAALPVAGPMATLANLSPPAGDQYGSAVAVSANLIVIGAPRENAGAIDAGGAYVYDTSSATPTIPIFTLHRASSVENDYFGAAAAISGSWVAVGAPRGTEPRAGTVYIYHLASATPSEPVFVLPNPAPLACDNFGLAVALSGNRLVVGASGPGPGSGAGFAFIYDLAQANPAAEVVTLANPEPEPHDTFGNAVAISGSRLVVGAFFDGLYDHGRAYVYDLESGTPTVPTVALLAAPNAYSGLFGSTVAISGTRVVVGASGSSASGNAFVYDLGGATPAEPVAVLGVGNLGYGSSVAVSGNLVVTGNWKSQGGVVSLFDFSSFTPNSPTSSLDNPLGPVHGGFGLAVAVDGGRVVIGANSAVAPTYAQGAAYVYQTPVPDSGTLPPALGSPATNAAAGNPVNVSFSLPETAAGRTVSLRFQGPVLRFFTLAAPYESSGPHAFSFAPANPMASPAFRPNGSTGDTNLPDGLYTVMLRYQDAPGNFAASASATNVRIETAVPTGGTMTFSPPSRVDAGAALTVSFAGWTDASLPVNYTVWIDNLIVSPASLAAARNVVAPMNPGLHAITGRITDGAGNFTDVTQSFTVNTAQETWRVQYFGTPQNTGDAADLADPDGDGLNNFFEWVSGSVPTSAHSRFQVRVEAVAAPSASKAIIFSPVLAGRTYTVQCKIALTEPAWMSLTNFATSEQGNERTVIDLATSAGPKFYRVQISQP